MGESRFFGDVELIDAAIVGLGWWGKNIVNAVQGKSTRLCFIHGVSKSIATQSTVTLGDAGVERAPSISAG